mgnify:FL=1
MSEKWNWECQLCGWKMFIDSDIIIDVEHPLSCGKCGSMFKSRT